MAYLGTSELEELLPHCIDPFKKENIDNVAYELCLGEEVYLTDSVTGKKEILDAMNSQVVIKPGQFALLLTDETLSIPDDILAFISIKFSQKVRGLVNVSGFHVDPGFVGKIIFSVYNAGPATIVLDKGEPYFMLWFSELTSNSIPYSGKHKNQQQITAENINALKGELASPNVLLKRIRSNESLLKNCIWASGILIALGIALSVKSFWDFSKFSEGYNIGVEERQIEEFEGTINSYNIDSIVSAKIASTLERKINRSDTAKAKH